MVETRHGFGVAALVGVMLNGQQFMDPLHLLLRQTPGQRQTQGLPRLDGHKIRVTSHRALFAPMIGLALVTLTIAAAFAGSDL